MNVSRTLSQRETIVSLLLALLLVMLPASELSALDVGFEDLTVGIHAASSTSLLIPDADGFVSPLNPGNVLGIVPLANTSSTLVTIEYSTLDDLFTLWASARTGLGDGDPASLDLRRLSYLRYFGDLRLTIGRQGLMTGYGYAWNPMDLVSPFKDLNDPNAERDGVDGLSLLWDAGSDFSLEVYGVCVPTETTPWPLDLRRLGVGGEAVWYLPDSGIEVRTTALIGPLFLDPAPSTTPVSLGAGVYGDLEGMGLYAEASVRSESRIPSITATATAEPGVSWPLSLLLGAEYYFAGGLSLVAEYLYHGEGLSAASRDHFADAVMIDPDLAIYYRPGLFARHYIMILLSYPLYDLRAELMTTLLASPDSGAITLRPAYTWYLSDTLTLQMSYTGMVSLPELFATDPLFVGSDEAALSPVRNLVTFSIQAQW